MKLRSWFVDLVPVADGLDPVYKNYLYYSRRRAFNPTMVFVGTFLGCGVLAFLGRAGIVALIAQTLFGAYLFLSTRAVARSLQFRRTIPDKVSEGESIKISWEIDNPSAFRADDVVFTDRWGGSLEPEETVWLDEPIKSFRSVHGTYTKNSDAGMGLFPYGPFIAYVSDALGIFTFLMIDDTPQSTEVYPRITLLPDMPIRGSKESFTYGIYDVASRGLSSNFIGVRDYVRGDSLRHISWKLTLKARKLLVKEFEKSVNAEITLILDMTSLNHMGWQAESTWEYAKDIALSIVSREMSNGNSIQLVSNHRMVPGGQGEYHNLQIIKSVFDLVPENDPASTDLAARASNLIRSGTTAVYIGPVFRPEFNRVARSLTELTGRAIDVIAVLLDAGSFVRDRVHGKMKVVVKAQAEQGRKVLEEASVRLASAGVITYVIRSGCDVGEEMLKPIGEAAVRAKQKGPGAS